MKYFNSSISLLFALCLCFGINAQVPGCTDAAASNFDSSATEDDGSCLYLCSEDPANLLTVSANTGFDGGSGLSFGNNSSMGLLQGANNDFGGFIWDVGTSGLSSSEFCISIDYTVMGDPSVFPITLEFRIENNGCGGFPCPWNDFNTVVNGPGTFTLGGIVSSGSPSAAGAFDPDGQTPSVVAAIANFSGTPMPADVIVTFNNLCVSTNCGAVPGCTDPLASNFDPDAVTDNGSCLYTVDFSVDLSNELPVTEQIFVFGSFNGWCPDCNEMTDPDGDNVYTASVDIPIGNYEYKYTQGTAGSGMFTDEILDPIGDADCTIATDIDGTLFVNRVLEVNGPEMLPTVCWGECVSCGNATPSHDITFQVDMNEELPLSGPVFVFGSFNGWCPNCIEMTDTDGDGVYTAIVSIPEGSYEFKYTVDDAMGGFADEVLDMVEDATCTVATDDGNGGFFVNRELTVTMEESLAVVCFGSCDSCTDPTACIPENFSDAPIGLFEDQTVSNGNKTQLKFDHYSDASSACLLRGGTIGSLDPSAPFTQAPGQVLIQGVQVAGNADGNDFSAQLAPDATFTLFNANTFPAGATGSMVPGAFYKWQVRCGCLIDPTLPLPDRLGAANVILSPWSAFDTFTNLGTPLQPNDDTQGNLKNLDTEKSIKLFPNPNNGEFVVDFINFDEGQVTLTIRNMLGEAVSTSTYLNNSKNHNTRIDVSELPKGNYIAEVVQGAVLQTQLFIVK